MSDTSDQACRAVRIAHHTLLSTLMVVQLLVDVGAGSGLFSLAAAARGHPVLAFELSPKSVASLQASVEYNGFQKLLSLHQVRCMQCVPDCLHLEQ